MATEPGGEDVLAARVRVRLASTETELRNLQQVLDEALRAEVRGESALPAIYAGVKRAERRQERQVEDLAARRRRGGVA